MIKLFLIVLTVVYPFLIYAGLSHFSPGLMALVLGTLFVLRFAGSRTTDRLLVVAPATVVAVYSLFAAISNSTLALKFYPVVISLTMLLVFAITLKYPPSMIERIATMQGAKISEKAGKYVRKLTMVWCGFFVTNAAIAAWTVTQSTERWLLYNGLLSYLLIGLLFGLEFLYRKHYQRRVGIHS